MWSLNDYRKAKCADPGFLDLYHEQCSVCPKTVLIFATLRERGLSFEEVARMAGVSPEDLRLLEEGERCSFEDVRKLGRCLNLSLSDECRKLEWRRQKQLKEGTTQHGIG